MFAPLLATKLHIPPVRAKWVHRPHLIKQLGEGLCLGRKLTLISAPAGFGKTTLLSEWLADCERSVAWTSLDEGDNHPNRFWRYVIAALQTIDAAIGKGVQAMLGSTQPPPLEMLVTVLTNDIVAASQTGSGAFPCVLVLDDYHVIEAESIHQSLGFWLDHLPPALHLVLATRSDPPLALSRRRGRAEMTEFRAADLRFSFEEATTFFNQVMELDLAAEDIAVLERRTEGWIVGLQMAAISMQGTVDRRAFVTAFAGDDRYVADYLVEEVLRQQPPRLQAFLLQTSILNSLNGPLCDAVCGRDDSQDVIVGLERANLFVIPLDNCRDWYRYHHLFADLLRRRLSRLGEDHAFELHRRAGAWYEQQGMVGQSIHHNLAAEDFEKVARLIEHHAEELDWTSGYTTVLGWVENLPRELVHARPALCLIVAWALHTLGHLDAIEPYLQSIESYLRNTGFDLCRWADQTSTMSPEELAEARRLMGKVLNVRALVMLLRGEPPQAIEQFQRLLALLPEGEQELRRDAAVGLAEAYYLDGNVPAASQAYVETIELGQGKEDIVVAVSLMRLAELQVMGGHLHQAFHTYQRLRQISADQAGRHMYVTGMANYGQGNLMREWNDLDAAEEQLRRGLECGARWVEPRLLLSCTIGLARVLQAQGDTIGALEAIEQAVQVERKHGVTWAWGLPLATAFRPRLWLAQGDLESAARWAREHGPELTANLCSSREVEILTVARVLIAQKNAEAALALLRRLRQVAKAGGRTRHVIEVLALGALALQAQGDIDAALNALAEALNLAEPEGYVRLFVDEGPPMARLLYQAARQGIATEYAGRLLAAHESPDKVAKPRTPECETLIEPLSEREIEVLQLIAEGLTNREIAQTLCISLGTVKAHTANMYGKLMVHSRTQAVARAQALGLLPN